MDESQKDVYEGAGCLGVFLLGCSAMTAAAIYADYDYSGISVIWYMSLVLITFDTIFFFARYKKGCNANKQLNEEIKDASLWNTRAFQKIRSLMKQLSENREQNGQLLCLLKSKTPFIDSARLVAECTAAVYKNDEIYLRTKPRPGTKSADLIKEIRVKMREILLDAKTTQYRYDFLLAVFPELCQYINDDETLLSLAKYKCYDSFQEERDYVQDWISAAEYKSLPPKERNQLALDRYKKRDKGLWELGIEYELYVGYLMREGLRPFKSKFDLVDQYGERMGLNDLGRDIVATSTNKAGFSTYIVQCKRYGQEKVIHENVVCQLYGTALVYDIKNNKNDLLFAQKTVPLLIATVDLSETAKLFAKTLNVKFLKIPMGEYPMIKCNIDSHIYHLPFDQQYHTTQIIPQKGEFYAWSVKEAEDKGYRRAWRHNATNGQT